jgi:hypothetical protein
MFLFIHIIPLIFSYFYCEYSFIAIWLTFLVYIIIHFGTICGIPLKTAMKIANEDKWLNQPYKNDNQKRYIVFNFQSDWIGIFPTFNVIVQKFNHGNQPINSWLINKVEEKTVFKYWNLTFNNFLAICFSTFCNKPVYEKFEQFKKFQPYKFNNIEKMYIAHVIWIMSNLNNFDVILDDHVISSIRNENFREMNDTNFFKMIETINLKNLFNIGYFAAYKKFIKSEKAKNDIIIQDNLKNDLSIAIKFLN